jgi:hypothetical protein
VTAASTDNIASSIELITDAIDIFGELNTSDADLTITRANNGSIGVGTAMGDLQISGAELAQITTNELLIGGGQTTDINVGGVSSAQSMNIDALKPPRRSLSPAAHRRSRPSRRWHATASTSTPTSPPWPATSSWTPTRTTTRTRMTTWMLRTAARSLREAC